METLIALGAPLGRTALQVLGAYLATKGFIDEASFTAISGAALTLITTGFTVYATHARVTAAK